MGSMPGKTSISMDRPFWIVDNNNGTYQVGTLLGEIMPKWVNGFRLKPYKGSMPTNPFQVRVGVDTDNQPIM